MADTATDALLMQAGERLNIGEQLNARRNLLKLFGEEQQKRIIEAREQTADIAEVALDPIDKDEVTLAQLQIREMHPLSDTPLADAFPWLCCCLRPCRAEKKPKASEQLQKEVENINKGLNSVIAKAEGAKYTGTSFRKDLCKKFGVAYARKDGEEKKAKEKPMSAEEKDSPFAEYGFGIKAWIGTLNFLFLLYIVLSLLAFVIMKQYEGFHGLEKQTSLFGALTKYSMGNIGFATSMCFFQYAQIPKPLELKCNTGTLSHIQFAGAVSSKQDITLKKKDDDGAFLPVGNDFCGKATDLSEEADCTKYLDVTGMKDDYSASDCFGKDEAGKSSCLFSPNNYLKVPDDADAKEKERCQSKLTQIYIQVNCDLSKDEVTFAQQTVVMTIFMGMIISVVFNVSITYLDKIQTYTYKKWDIDTCTPADYTVKMEISQEHYDKYLAMYGTGEDATPLDQVIKEKLEQGVNAQASVLENSIAAKSGDLKVASITFAYKNGELIRALRQRGYLIGTGQFHKVPEQDDLLNTIISQDLDKLRQPVAAFVTFTDQEAYERCEEYFFKYVRTDGSKNPKYEDNKFELFDKEVLIEQAPEPSNILWENQEVSPYVRKSRKCGVVVLISLFIFLTFLLYSALKSKSGRNKLMYPSTTPCDEFDAQFNVSGVPDLEDFKYYAEFDKKETLNMHGSGYYMCYCKLHSKYSEIAKQEKPEEDLCYQYREDEATGYVLTNTVTVLVSVINIVIRTLNIKLIKLIGYPTESKQTSLIMQSVFWATFINTGIILLMTNAEMKYAPYPFKLSDFMLKGQFPDLDENWYEQIGPQLAKTMFIMAVYPYLEMLIFGGLWYLYQCMDSGCQCTGENTNAKTPYQYINLYAGPMYLMHFKYSSILTQVYISFMYGLFLPVLFPIAAFGIFNMYVVEKFALLYYYRKPPMYDEKLQQDAIKILYNAPIAMFIMGYWAISNQQIFFGYKSPRMFGNAVSDPNHPLVDHGHGLNHTHWVFCLIFCLFVKKIIIDSIVNCVKWIAKNCCDYSWNDDVLGKDVEEPIDNYWASMTGDDQKIWYASEVYSKFRFGIQSVDDEGLDCLRTIDRRKAQKEYMKAKEQKPKFMEGDCRYDILSIVTYQQEFQYISIEQRNELPDFVLSDMILRALNLDDDRKSNKEDDPTIFTGSFAYLVAQANASKDQAKEKSEKDGETANEGGYSDAFYRMAL